MCTAGTKPKHIVRGGKVEYIVHRNNLKRARLRAGLTQAQVATMAGLSRAAYTNIELGRKNPSLDTALRLAEVLGQSVEDLFGVSAAHVQEASA